MLMGGDPRSPKSQVRQGNPSRSPSRGGGSTQVLLMGRGPRSPKSLVRLFLSQLLPLFRMPPPTHMGLPPSFSHRLAPGERVPQRLVQCSDPSSHALPSTPPARAQLHHMGGPCGRSTALPQSQGGSAPSYQQASYGGGYHQTCSQLGGTFHSQGDKQVMVGGHTFNADQKVDTHPSCQLIG